MTIPKEILRNNNNLTTLGFIMLVVLQSCTSKPEVKPQDLALPINTIETLRQNHESKILTNDEYYLYMTYAIFSQESLPENYRGTIGPRDGTPVIMEVQRAYYSLQPETQDIIRQWIRPLPQKPTKRKP
jgi:hypothetical protein